MLELGRNVATEIGRQERGRVSKLSSWYYIHNQIVMWLTYTLNFMNYRITKNYKVEEEMRQAIDNYLDLLKIGVKEVPK